MEEEEGRRDGGQGAAGDNEEGGSEEMEEKDEVLVGAVMDVVEVVVNERKRWREVGDKGNKSI